MSAASILLSLYPFAFAIKASNSLGFGPVVLLTGCSGDKAKMLQQLEQLEQQNRSGEAMLNDSLAESLQRFTKYIAQRCKTSDG